MTILQITAILSLLMAFGVDAPTLANVHDLLIPPIVNAAPATINYVPVTTSPIVENAPVYFGSTVDNTPAPVAPVVALAPMEPTVIDAISIDRGTLHVSSTLALNLQATILPEGVTLGAIEFSDRVSKIGANGKGHGYGVKLEGLPEEFAQIAITLVDVNGGQVTKTVVVR